MIASGFVEAGVSVIIASRKEDSLKEVADELSEQGDCSYVVADLSTEEGAARSARRWRSAGTPRHPGQQRRRQLGAPLAEQDTKSWHRVLDVNVEGVFHTTKFLLPLLQAAGTAEEPARVINIGSVDGIQVPGFETYAYSASKAAVHQLTRHLAKHLAPAITVNAIAPGPFQSRMMRATLEAAGDGMAKMMPLQADRPARGHGRSGDLPHLEGRRLPHRHDHPRRRRHRHDEVAGARCPSSRRPPRGGSRPVDVADEHGVVGVGADLEPGTLLAAYRQGIFPMPAGRDGPMALVVARPAGRPPPRRPRGEPVAAPILRRYEVRVDSAFDEVDRRLRATRDGPAAGSPTTSAPPTCACTSSAGRTASRRGTTTGLAGGLYGVAIGGLFAGESMFHRRTDASKVALVGLVDLLRRDGDGRRLLDVQWTTAHLASLGAVDVARAEYLAGWPRRAAAAAPVALGATRDLRARRRPPGRRPADLGPSQGDQRRR